MTRPYLKGLAPTSLSVIKFRAQKLGYLADVSKMRAALVYEFGEDAPMPNRAFLQAIVDKRAEEFARFRRACEASSRCGSKAGANDGEFRVRGLV
jgi:hypothetical protein